MGRFFYLSKKNPNNKRVFRERRFIPRMNMKLILAGAIFISIVSYLVQSNGIATKGYEIKKLEQLLGDLRQVTRQLENKSLELQSLQNVSAKIVELNMVSANNAEYLEEEPRVVTAN